MGDIPRRTSRLIRRVPGFRVRCFLVLDVVKFDEEYWKTLADHETALAPDEQLTG